MKRYLACLLSCLVCLLGVGVAPLIAQSEIDTVCLITDVGQVDDGTFNQRAYEGMLRAAEEFDLETSYIETQAQTDYEANIETCVRAGFDIIITVGFALDVATYEAALANPDKYFIAIDVVYGEEQALPNLVGLSFKDDQGGFLAGALAAMMTQTNIVAGIYGIDIPPVVRFRNGFEQGARYINPNITTLGVYIPDFQAPDDGASAAAQFIGEGADVIFGAGGPTGSGGISYAASEGVLVIGVDQDEFFTTFAGGETPGAEYLISSALKRVDNGVYDMIKAVVEGEGFPEGSNYILEAANGGIDFAEPHLADVPTEVTERLTEILEGLRDGTISTGVDFETGQVLPEVTPEATEDGS